MPSTVLVTGANGFVGRALCRRLAEAGHRVRAATRDGTAPEGAAEAIAVGEITPVTDWREALDGADRVVHLAARVHRMRESGPSPMTDYRIANTFASVRLGLEAVKAGTQRLVFVSTAKVHGEASPPGRPFTEADPPAPDGPYAISKAEAEAELAALGRERGLEVAIVRPPLVYGPGVRGNVLALMRLVDRGLPLPLGAVGNRRSLVGVRNLADLLARCIEAPEAAGQTVLASDGPPMSTPELIRRIAAALGRPARLVPLPPALLSTAAALAGQRAAAARLVGSFEVDSGRARDLLGWAPPVPVEEELAATAAWFRKAGRG
jgi:nucleoside-diphosphate-sugar epimerase